MPRYEPDPLRDAFTAGARVLLDRAYANPYRWQATRLADPGPAALRRLAALDIDWQGPDNSSAAGGRARARPGLNARDRWTRSFIRCLYEQHRWWAADPAHRKAGWLDERRTADLPSWNLEIDVGRRVVGGRQAGTLLRPGRAVRIRIRRSRPIRQREVTSPIPYGQRVFVDESPAGRWSDASRRDWQEQ